MSSYIDVLGLRFSESRVECLKSFLESLGENLRRGTSENISGRTQVDVRNVFILLRRCVRNSGEGYSCLGVDVPVALRYDLDDAFRDIAVYYSFHKKYDKKVLDLFFSVIDVLISTLN